MIYRFLFRRALIKIRLYNYVHTVMTSKVNTMSCAYNIASVTGANALYITDNRYVITIINVSTASIFLATGTGVKQYRPD